jgi:enterochelin esterase-like enzyme
MPRTRSTGRATGAGQPAVGDSPAEASVSPKVQAEAASPAEAATEADAAIPVESIAGAEAAVGAEVPEATGSASESPRGSRRALDSVSGLVRRNLGVPVSAAVALLAFVGASVLGPTHAAYSVLIGLGFDLDRAQLITGLVIGGGVAVLASLGGGVRWSAVVAGCVAFGALFGPTFVHETQNALAATGVMGAFDPMGWAITLGALIVISTLTAWACATCALPVRRELVATSGAVARVAGLRSLGHGLWARPAAALLVICLLVVSLPTAGDMFNYGAGALMIGGGPPRQGLVPGDVVQPELPLESAGPMASASPSPDTSPGASVPATATPAPTPLPSPTREPSPWTRWRPKGAGSMQYLSFAAPWKSEADPGSAVRTEVAVYLPPGYDTDTARRYPVMYEVPWAFAPFKSGTGINSVMDTLIDDGTIAASIVVFVEANGGPYADTECVDSFDGLQWVDRYIATIVPPFIDQHYRTIAKPAARSIFGFSEGAFCSANIMLRHPDVFGVEVSMSGYFTAGSVGASAKAPFGGNAAVIAANSPSLVALKIPEDERANLYFILFVQTSQVFYGGQTSDFAKLLKDNGYPHEVNESDQPHGWIQTRQELQRALVAICTRERDTGVFD